MAGAWSISQNSGAMSAPPIATANGSNQPRVASSSIVVIA